METLYCDLCDFTTVTVRHLNYHLVRKHRFSQNIRLSCKLCSFVSSSYSSYKSHQSRQHKQRNNFEFTTENADIIDNLMSNNIINITAEEDAFKRQCGLFTLQLMTKNRLPATTVDEILSGAANLLNYEKELSVMGSSENVLKHLEELKTDKRRMRYIRSHNNYIEPRRVFMGSSFSRKNGRLLKKTDYGYVAPVVETITQYLNQRDVFNEICSDNSSKHGLMEDMCDGSMVKENNFIASHKPCLLFMFSTDSVQITNAIGHHKSHKLDVFYWCIVNLKSKFRCKWSNIQVYALCKTSYIQKYGFRNIMFDFIDSMKKLRQGIQVNVCGKNHTIFGMLLSIVCDNPASTGISGTKCSSMKAHKICRACNVSSREIQYKLTLGELEKRCHALHLERCEALEKMKGKMRTNWSSRYGINHTSVFLELDYIQIADHFPFDLFHTLHENTMSFVMALILQKAITDNAMSIELLNSKIQGFKLSYLDASNKPEPINRKHLFESVKMHQTGATIWHLQYYLAFIISEKFDDNDPYFKNFMTLIAFANLACSPVMDVNTAGEMQVLIESFLIGFKELYPTIPIRPSMHFLLHTASEILKYGPCRWWMLYRMESKNNSLKQLHMKNFINAAFSLLKHNQLNNCYNYTRNSGLYEAEPVAEGYEERFFEIYPHLRSRFIEATKSDDDLVYATKQLSLDGLRYRAGACLLMEWPENFPHFARIKHLYVQQEKRIAVCADLCTVCFEWKVNAYEVTESDREVIVIIDDMVNKWPVPMYSMGNRKFIVNRHCHFGGGVL